MQVTFYHRVRHIPRCVRNYPLTLLTGIFSRISKLEFVADPYNCTPEVQIGMTDLTLSEPDDYSFFFLRFDRPSFDGRLKTVTTTVAKEILTCRKRSLTVSVYLLRFAVWRLEIILKSWNSKGLHLNQLELLCWRGSCRWAGSR